MDAIVTLFESGLSIQEVAKRTARCYQTVRQHLVKQGAHQVKHKRVQDGKAICNRCGRRRKVDEFPAISQGKYACRNCLAHEQHGYGMRRLGCTPEQYQELLRKQGGKCAICGTPEGHRSRYGRVCRFSVDHNHQTGTVRGLLCNNCNRGLGRFKDSATLLEAALRYLQGGQ